MWALDPRRVQGKYRVARSSLLHPFEPQRLDVRQVRLQARPEFGRRVILRLVDCEIDGEVLFERDLVTHHSFAMGERVPLKPGWRDEPPVGHIRALQLSLSRPTYFTSVKYVCT